MSVRVVVNSIPPPVSGPPQDPASRFLPAASLAVLFVAASVVAITSAERYLDPIGEKYFKLKDPGAADFRQTFAGTRALARGENPYFGVPGDGGSEGRGATIEGRFYKVAYPPSQLLFYLPLAKLVDNPRQAGRILFWLNLALLMGLSGLTCWLLVAATDPPPAERRLSWLLLPLLYFILTANVGTSLGLERGQSDIVGAVLCWGAVVAFLKDQRLLPAFLLASAILLKGYALLLGLGLGLLGLPKRGFWPQLAGVSLAVALLLLPVMPYVADGFVAARYQSQNFKGPYWINHGFKNLSYSIAPAWAERGRVALAAIGLLTTAGCWLRARSALRQGEQRSVTLWVSLFALCSLGTAVGYGAASFVYNQVLFLPGAFILLLLSEPFARECRLPLPFRRVLPAGLVLTTFLLFKYRLWPKAFPLAAVGLSFLLLICGAGVVCHAVAEQRRDPA